MTRNKSLFTFHLSLTNMGSKNKLKRFKENETFANVIQPNRQEVIAGNFPLKGVWVRDFFKNDHPIVLELGCGRGEYTVNLAKQYPDKNFIGVDIKGARFWRGAKTALEEQISNAAFQIKYKRTKHRLTNQDFLAKYKHILSPDGLIHLKTDSEYLHGYTLGLLHGMGHEILYANHHIYRNEGAPQEVLAIQTTYEKQYLAQGKPITYIRFRLKK